VGRKGWVFGWGSRGQEFQHGFHAPVVQFFFFACHLAGGLHLGAGILIGEAQDAQAGAESLFGVPPGGQDRLDHLAGMRSDILRPALQALGCPFPGFLVFDRHVGGLGRITARYAAAGVDGHGFGFAFVEYLEHTLAGTHAHFLVNQLIRYRVEMLLELDVVVDIHPGGLPGSVFKGHLRQRKQGGPVQFFEELLAGLAQMLHGTVVQFFQQPDNCTVQFCQAEKSPVAQTG